MIKRLYVHNFRCLGSFAITFGNRQTALLIGRNGSGKSTLGYALELFQQVARGVNRVGDLVKIKDFTGGRTALPMSFELEASVSGVTYVYELDLELPEGFKELRVQKEKLTADGKELLLRESSQVSLRGAGEGAARFLVDWHLVALPIIQEVSTQDPISVFRQWLARMLILAPVPTQMLSESEGDTLQPDRSLSQIGAWFTGLLLHSPSAYSDMDAFLRDVLPDLRDFKNPAITREFRSLEVQFSQDGEGLVLPYTDLSDGEKCLFACSLVIAANRAYGPLTCFWDEPDNFLSLDEVSHFVLALRRAFEQGGQFLATSHNPEVIRSFTSTDTFVLARKSHFHSTMCRVLEETPVTGDLINALTRGDLWP